MSRPIKFRAWLKNPQRMCDVEALFFGDGKIFAILSCGDTQWGNCLVGVDCELIQFTGCFDENDDEICEGDIIVMVDEAVGKIEKARARVVFWERPPEFGLAPIQWGEWCDDWNLNDDSERMKIIGNIYETPYFLEPKEDE